MTMNNTWGFKRQDTDWKSSADLIRKLIDIAHKGGNFLLNVGPTGEGEIPAASVERLREVGAWLARNGEAIYGTTASPIPYLSWGRATRKGNVLYLHVFDWPADGQLRVPMQVKVTGAHLLARPDEPLKVGAADAAHGAATTRGGLVIHLPTRPPAPADAPVTVIKLAIEGEPVVAPPLTRNQPAAASFGDAKKAFDGSAGRSWEAQKGDKSGWVEVDLQQPEPVAALAFDEPHRGAGKRGQKYRLQVRAGADWREVASGETKSYGATASFATVTGQVFRLEIFESKDTAAVAEFQLYRPE
jgi:alpha-L-fucosidase